MQVWRLFNNDVGIESFFFFFKKCKNHSLESIFIQSFLYTICYTDKCNKIPVIQVTHDFLNNSFFPSTIIEWNKLDWNIQNFENIETFEKRILMFIRPSPNSTFNCHNSEGIKLLSHLGLLVFIIFSTVPIIWKKDWYSWTL